MASTLEEAMARNPHLRDYVGRMGKRKPEFHRELSYDMKVGKAEEVNIIYPVGDPYYVHIEKPEGGEPRYTVIGPTYTSEEMRLFRELYSRILKRVSLIEKIPRDQDEFINRIIELTREMTIVEDSPYRWVLEAVFDKTYVPPGKYRKIRELVIRELAQHSTIEPFMRDPYIEDLSCVGTNNMWVVHKIFGAMETNVRFEDEDSLEDFIYRMTELLNRPASEVKPIVDAALQDGSRLNVIYSRDVSIRGASFTIRKFTKVPISITQLIRWNTISELEAAYFWLATAAGASIFISGETAAGKTTTLKAITAFIDPRARIFSVEDTPEIYVPHKNWERTVTAEKKAEMFDLLKSSLRARPDYIIVGEIRGQEGYVAFQAMQTGHPVMSTFHAGSVNSFIRRVSGPPINVPKEYIPNLNIIAIQQSVARGGKAVRRMITMSEIEKYHAPSGSIVAREVFRWDTVADKHAFRAWYNSYVLEELVAPTLGFTKEEVYNELRLRASILHEMRKRNIIDYFQVYELIRRYAEFGLEGLPFTVEVMDWQ